MMNCDDRFLDELKYNSQGLIPAIIQDFKTAQVLMMAWMNDASIRLSLETGKTHFWSRSRNRLWMKGESSGNFQMIKEISLDCDSDVILIRVEQVGMACHKGYASCFFRALKAGKLTITEEQIQDPETIYGNDPSSISTSHQKGN